MATPTTRVRPSLAVAVPAAATLLSMEAQAYSDPESPPELTAPIEPARAGLGGDQLLVELQAHGRPAASATSRRWHELALLSQQARKELL